MNDSGYVRPKYHTLNMLKRMAVVTPRLVIGNPILNAIEIVRIVKELNYSVDSEGVAHGGVQGAVFPELCMVGHSVGHLHLHERTHSGVLDGLRFILKETATINMLFVIGAPWQAWGRNFNVQIVIYKGRILAIIPKQDLTSTAEYQEHKFFVSGDDAVDDVVIFDGEEIPFNMHVLVEFPDEGNLVFGFTNCEDDWGPDGKGQLALLHGATVIMHSNASSEFVGKAKFKLNAFNVMAALGFGAWLYAASGPWESGRDFIYGGHSFISDRGTITAETPRFSFETQYAISDVDVDACVQDKMRTNSFSNRARRCKTNFKRIPIYGYLGQTDELKQNVYDEVHRIISPKPFVPSDPTNLNEVCEEMWSILTAAAIRRLLHTGQTKMEVAWSGGLDSFITLLALLRAAEQLNLDPEHVVALTMPHSKSTSDQTYRNVYAARDAFHMTLLDENIEVHVEEMEKSVVNLNDGEELTSLVRGNLKAWARTFLVLADSSARNALQFGTGTNSEIGEGWDTLFADSIGRFNILQALFKTMSKAMLVYEREVHFKDDPEKQEVITLVLDDTPQSAELDDLGTNGEIVQETELILGPVELRDFFQWGHVRFGRSPLKLAWYANQAFKGVYSQEYIKWVLYTFLNRHFGNIFKARTRCDGPATGSVTMDPNNMYVVPSDMKSGYWYGWDLGEYPEITGYVDDWDLIPGGEQRRKEF